MKTEYSFLEVNPVRRDQASSNLSLCFFNIFDRFSTQHIQKSISLLKKNELSFSVNLIDFKGELAESGDLDHFLKEIPGCRILFPGKGNPLSGLSLFLKENQSDYILLLSCDLILTKFDLNTISSEFRKEENVSMWVPKVNFGDDKMDTIHGVAFTNEELHVSVQKYQSGLHTILPWKMSCLIDRERFVNLSSFDDRYENYFMASLDAGWKLYSHGDRIGCVEGFVCEMSVVSTNIEETELFENFNEQFEFEKKLFVCRNVHTDLADKFVKKIKTQSFFSFDFKKKQKIKMFLKEREKARLGRSVFDEELFGLF